MLRQKVSSQFLIFSGKAREFKKYRYIHVQVIMMITIINDLNSTGTN